MEESETVILNKYTLSAKVVAPGVKVNIPLLNVLGQENEVSLEIFPLTVDITILEKLHFLA